MGPVLLVLSGALLAGCPHGPPRDEPDVDRSSRPGAGTVVGVVTARGSGGPAGHARAFAALEQWESRLSEWREGSVPRRAMAGERPGLDPLSRGLFALALDLRDRTGGAFDVCWKGGAIHLDGDVLRADPGTQIDLGGVLKGFLADRMGDALLDGGVRDFVVDVGGDVLAHGSPRGDGGGWPVDVDVAGRVVTFRLRDEAVSTTSAEQQPGHVRDARTGAAAMAYAGVYTRAPSGLYADATATAVFAAGAMFPLPTGVCAWAIRPDGSVEQACGRAAPASAPD